MKILLVGEGANELSGALEKLVRRLGLAEADIQQDRVSRPSLHAHHGKGQGYYKRAIRWMLEAKKQGYDALVLVIDQDGNQDRVHEIDSAQDYTGTPLRRALGVAIRTFDAWMLADESALTAVLGQQVSRQPDPENLRDPKGLFRGFLEVSEKVSSVSRAYASIANHADLEKMSTRCKNGFRPFAQRIQIMQ